MKFDVFVSFRGADTRRTFVSHLWRSFDRKRFRTFKHEEDILENKPASSEVLQVIDKCRVAVAIISKNYTSSVWCLDELEKMIECKEKSSLLVMPVFYEVDHLDVVRQAEHLANDLIGARDNLEKVKRWSDALESLTHIPGHSSCDWEDDSNMIDDIVDEVSRHLIPTIVAPSEPPKRDSKRMPTFWTDDRDVLRKMAGRYMSGDKPIRVEPRPESSVAPLGTSVYSETHSLLGMDRHMKAINTLLDMELDDGVREIGIWGVVGVGKTTLARFVYEQISQNFQEHFYLVNDTRHCQGRSSTCLLENITRDVIKGHNLTWNHNVVKAKLGHQKVLLIVDGLEISSELQYIKTISRWFGRGSRLILVGESKNLLIHNGVDHLYKLESLNYDEALQLFSQYAFKQEYITRRFDQLSARAVFIAGHLPLAIKVLGSFLYRKDVKEWECELRKLEASKDNWIIEVLSTYIGGDFIRRQSTNLDRCIGEEDEGDEFPSYCFSLG